MEIEITKENENQLLGRKEVLFTLKHEGASPGREEARNALTKALQCGQNLLVIDKMNTKFGKKETVGYAKVYQNDERLKDVERAHIIRRNFGASGEAEGE